MRKDRIEAVSAWMGKTAHLADTAQTMEVLYHEIMERNPKNPAYLYFDEDNKPKTVSYEEWDKQCHRAASQLHACLDNLEKESIVAIKVKNSPRWPILFWAIVMNGFTPLLLDARLPKENTDNLLRQSGAKALIANDEEEFAVPHLRVNEIFSRNVEGEYKPEFGNHMIFCSSGTTGDAKMMIYEGKNLCAQVLASLNIPSNTADLMYPSQIRCLAMLPFHHVFGFMVNFLWYTYYGKTLVYPASLATSDLLYACRVGKCTHIFSVPLFWDGVATAVNRMMATQKPGKIDLFTKMVAYHTKKISFKEAGFASSSLVLHTFQKKLLGKQVRYCISGGGYLSPKTQALINGLGYPLYNGWGMTEIGIASVEQSPRVEQRIKGSIGKPFHGIEYKIDSSKGEVNEQGLPTGELMVRSPIIHEEEIIGGKHGKVKLEDGFFRTGDIAYCDAQGNYYLKGRIKDTIILSNGENVFPDEIEYYFKNVANVRNLACLGAKPKGEAEEAIVLVCEIENGLSEEAIKKIHADIKTINDTLPSEKKVMKVLLSTTPLPMSGSMKVKRFVLKDAIEQGSEEFLDSSGASKREPVSFEGYDEKDVKETIEAVTKVFSSILMLPASKIDPEAIWNVELGGDSMSYIEMCQALDSTFGITIPEEKYGVLGCVADFAKEILDLQGKKKN